MSTCTQDKLDFSIFLLQFNFFNGFATSKRHDLSEDVRFAQQSPFLSDLWQHPFRSSTYRATIITESTSLVSVLLAPATEIAIAVDSVCLGPLPTTAD